MQVNHGRGNATPNWRHTVPFYYGLYQLTGGTGPSLGQESVATGPRSHDSTLTRYTVQSQSSPEQIALFQLPPFRPQPYPWFTLSNSNDNVSVPLTSAAIPVHHPVFGLTQRGYAEHTLSTTKSKHEANTASATRGSVALCTKNLYSPVEMGAHEAVTQCHPTALPSPPCVPYDSVDRLIMRLWNQDHDSSAERNRLLSLRGDEACVMLDALQSWLHLHPQHIYARKVLRLLVDIAAVSEQLPGSLLVHNVYVDLCQRPIHGGFADVFHGILDDHPVAIKYLRINEDGDANSFKELCREGLVWRQLEHPNILPFLGIDGDLFHSTGSLAMVSPWMKQGTIMTFIRSSEYDPRRDRLRLIVEVAKGLAYLHSREIAHGDLHDRNVLITDHGHACLTDFGLTVIGDLTRSRLTPRGTAGTFRWMAPEHVSEEAENTLKRPSGDVFAFGRLLLAICTKATPFHNKKEVTVLLGLSRDVRPLRPDITDCHGYEITDSLWALANACWAMDPLARPSMKDALARLK